LIGNRRVAIVDTATIGPRCARSEGHAAHVQLIDVQPGGVDERVHRAKALEHLGDERRARVSILERQRPGGGPATERLHIGDHLLGRLRATVVGDREVAAPGCEQPADGGTEAAAAAGDHGDAAA
jgi:hypothetical protein